MKRKLTKRKINKVYNEEARLALLSNLINNLDEENNSYTSGQIRMFLLDAVSVY